MKTITWARPILVALLAAIGLPARGADPTVNDVDGTGAAAADVEILEQNCTRTALYWRTHADAGPGELDMAWYDPIMGSAGPLAEFMLSGKSNFGALTTPPTSVYWILAHQFIAVLLNTASGADRSAVDAAFVDAAYYFASESPSDPISSETRTRLLRDAMILWLFNVGAIGPGHCPIL